MVATSRSKRLWRRWTEEETLFLLAGCRAISYSEIARHLGRTVSQVKSKAHRLGIQADQDAYALKRTSLGRPDFFTRWSPEMAYVLGFLYADGNIRDDGQVQVCLAAKDVSHLEAIKNMLGVTSKTYEERAGAAYRFAFRCLPVARELNALGVVPRKTKRIRFPDMREKYQRHFVRGYFDGDGSFHERADITGYLYAQVCGNNEFLSGLRDVIMGAGIERVGVPHSSKGIHGLTVSGRHALAFGEWIYAEGGLTLQRKQDVWERCRRTYRPVWGRRK